MHLKHEVTNSRWYGRLATATSHFIVRPLVEGLEEEAKNWDEIGQIDWTP